MLDLLIDVSFVGWLGELRLGHLLTFFYMLRLLIARVNLMTLSKISIKFFMRLNPMRIRKRFNVIDIIVYILVAAIDLL